MVWKWNRSYDESESFDWLLIRNGPIIKYYSKNVLEEDVLVLEKGGYEIFQSSMLNWNIDNYQIKISQFLNFPTYYGENFNAFKDCLDDKFNTRYKGLVIVLTEIDDFYLKNKEIFSSILSSIIFVSWIWLLTGQKLILLIQTENPNLETGSIECFAPSWNEKEWSNNAREI